MMISPVSFRATDAASWKNLLEKKQTYQSPTAQPAAASGLSDGGKKKSGVGKKILGTIAALGLAAGALALGHNKGWFVAKEGAKPFVKKGLDILNSGGKYVTQYGKAAWGKIKTGYGFVKDKVTELIGKIKPQQVADAVQEGAEALV